VLHVSIGSYLAFQDVIAAVKAQTLAEAVDVGKVVQGAVYLERQRDIDRDPAYGIAQIETIAWTSISSSKSDPAPGLLTLHSLRDILARWAVDAQEDAADPEPVAVVYTDNTFARLLDAFETLAVVSSESMQHQNFIEAVSAFTLEFDRVPPAQQQRAEDLILRILSVLGDHVLTAALNAALNALIAMLTASGRHATAAAVQEAQNTLGRSVGKLNSRATRVPTGG
jgi:uncharacterized membrane protein